ncbi:hypothetical protein ACFL0J_07915 [Candidatus Neomarinimicrobiota bacterium]
MSPRITYTESNEIIYCKRCGQIAGEPTECTGRWKAQHDFAKTKKDLTCARCGTSIGFRSNCIGGYESHDFKEIR